VEGTLTFRREKPSLWRLLRRVQVNYGPMRAEARPTEMVRAILEQGEGKTFILQAAGAADPVVEEARRQGLAAHVLFDASHGRGEVAASWPAVLPGLYCGYAGGLEPDNLAEQLGRIAEAAGDATVWIDMESRVRTPRDELDLGKVIRVLEVAAGFVGT
jgi:phosphoribosylanthranilate isomerase